MALDLGHSDCAGLFYNTEIHSFSPQGKSQAAGAANASANNESFDTPGEREPYSGFPRRGISETGDMSDAHKGEGEKGPWEDERLDGSEPQQENYPQPQDNNGDETGAEPSIADAETSSDLLGGETRAEEKHMITREGSIAVSRARNKWLSLIDRESGSTYYQNEQSGLTQWEAPMDDVGETGVGLESIAWKSSSTVIRAGNKWLSLIDRKSGSTYYQNERSGQTQWEVPEEGGDTEVGSNNYEEEQEGSSPTYEEPLPGGEEGDWSSSNAPYPALDNAGDALQQGKAGDPEDESSSGAGWMPSEKRVKDPQRQEKSVVGGEDDARPGDGSRSHQEAYYSQRQDEKGGHEIAAELLVEDNVETTRSLLLGEEEAGSVTKHIMWTDSSGAVIRARNKWLSLIDRQSGSIYYQNERSGLTQWEAPEDDGGDTGIGSNRQEKIVEDEQKGGNPNYEEPLSVGEEGDWSPSNTYSTALQNDDNAAQGIDRNPGEVGGAYYPNDQPALTQWESPQDGGESRTGTEPSSAREGSSSTVARERNNTWVSLIDGDSGNVYYQNVLSGLTQWEAPEDGKVNSLKAVYGDNLPLR